jgi:hypothetical protein
MKEVTNLSPYNQYKGRCFICSLEEAIEYVEKYCEQAHHVDTVKDFHNNLINKIWWASKHTLSDAGTKKIAHYEKKRNLLVIYNR